MALIFVLTTWNLTAAGYRMSVAQAYPADWSDATERTNINVDNSPAYLIVRGNVSAQQQTDIGNDVNYVILPASGTPLQAQVDTITAWLTNVGCSAEMIAAYVRTDHDFATIQDDLSYYSRYGVGDRTYTTWHAAPATFGSIQSQALPGDTIYLSAGTYTDDISPRGCVGRSITIRNEPGQRPTFDAKTRDISGIKLNGYDLLVIGLEFTNTDPTTRDLPAGSAQRNTNLTFYAPRTILANSIVHDGNVGVGFWEQAENSELYSVLIYNVGCWVGGAVHGHCIYTQNDIGIKHIQDVLCGPAVRLAIQVYGTGAANLKGYRIDHCLFTGSSINGQVVIGGGSPVDDFQYTFNRHWQSVVSVGYTTPSIAGTFTDNDFVSAVEGPIFSQWNTLTWLRNRSVIQSPATSSNTIIASGTDISAWTMDYSDCWRPGFGRWQASDIQPVFFTLAAWQSATGQEAHSITHDGAPTTNEVILRGNDYDNDRATVLIYNWESLNSVSVDLSGLPLTIGRTYKLHSVLDYDGDAQTFIYSGSPVSVPMTGHTQANPIAYNAPLVSSWFPGFGAFVLEAL